MKVFSTTHINKMHNIFMHMGLLVAWLWQMKNFWVQHKGAVHVSNKNNICFTG